MSADVAHCCSANSRVTLIKLPSHSSNAPASEVLTTFPSGSSTNDEMSVSSTFPNLPIAPWSFKPVNVLAIFQNLLNTNTNTKNIEPLRHDASLATSSRRAANYRM